MKKIYDTQSGIAKVMGLNPVGASEFFLGFICNCLSYFTTAKISFTSKNENVAKVGLEFIRQKYLMRNITPYSTYVN